MHVGIGGIPESDADQGRWADGRHPGDLPPYPYQPITKVGRKPLLESAYVRRPSLMRVHTCLATHQYQGIMVVCR